MEAINNVQSAGSTTMHSFNARAGSDSVTMMVRDGRIVALNWTDHLGACGISGPNLEDKNAQVCKASIDFIRLNNTKEFYKMKDALSEGQMKEHCLDILV